MSIRKKFALIAALCAVCLSGCKAEEKLPENVTAVPTETTSLTLTVALTEEDPFIVEPEEPEETRIELAVYDPFSDTVKVEGDVYTELQEAAEEIFDSMAFLNANFSGFGLGSEYFDNYAYTDTEMERNDEQEYVFYPLNTDFAATEQELYGRIRNVFTENYISDDELREALFTPEPYDQQPCYKTIDGILCMKWQYRGVMVSPLSNEISVISYDDDEAVVAAYGSGAAYPPYHVFMTLKKSSGGKWRLEETEYKEYNENEAMLLYNAISLNSEKLNKILGGGTTPDDPETTEVNGRLYTETDLDMTIAEMEEFFKDIFFSYSLEQTDQAYSAHIDGLLLKKYLDQYIYEVYSEENGKLFRKNDAPEWYLPELEIDPYADGISWTVGSDMELIFGENGGGFFAWMQPFRKESGETENYQVTVGYRYAKDSYDYQHIYIGKALPILEKGE